MLDSKIVIEKKLEKVGEEVGEVEVSDIVILENRNPGNTDPDSSFVMLSSFVELCFEKVSEKSD